MPRFSLEDLEVSLESEFPAEFLDGIRRRQRGVAKGPANEYQEMRKGILNDMCCGHPVTRCRIALLDAKLSESGSRVSIRAVQACDLSGKNCPVTANPDLASFRYVQSDCMQEAEHYVLYFREDYGAMMGVANHAGSCPVFYGNLVPYEFSGGTYMKVDPQSVLPSKIPFSLLTHNQHVDKARQDARESARRMLSGAGHVVSQLGPGHGLSDAKGDDFGPSL